jgi:hypothetical protein
MVANRYAIAGLAAVAATMVGAVLLVSLLVIGSLAAALASAAAALSCGWCWYAEPLRRRRALTHTPTPASEADSQQRAPSAAHDHAWDTGVRAAR